MSHFFSFVSFDLAFYNCLGHVKTVSLLTLAGIVLKAVNQYFVHIHVCLPVTDNLNQWKTEKYHKNYIINLFQVTLLSWNANL